MEFGLRRIRRRAQYGPGVVVTSLKFRLQKMGLGRFRILNPRGRKLLENHYHEVRDSSPREDHS